MMSFDEGDALMDASFIPNDEGVEDEMGSVNDVKKNLLSDLSDDSPIKQPDEGAMPPPPVPSTHDTSSEKMQIFLRIRPLQEDEKSAGENQGCVVVANPSRVDMIAPKDSKTFEHSAHGCGKVINSFNFSKVYENISQQRLFDDCMLTTVKDFVDGQNCLVFAYGVTNSGKTYTMQGPAKDGGIIPRSIEVIFNSVGEQQHESADLKPQLYCEVKRQTIKEMLSADKFKTMVITSASRATLDSTDLYNSSDSLASQSSVGESFADSLNEDACRTSINTKCQGNVKFSMWVSFAEIYNEQIFDLLEPLSKSSLQSKRKIMQLREDKNGNPYIKDLRHIHVTTAEEANLVLTFGQRNLQYACTKLNESSSRSHCIFTVKMVRVVDVQNPRRARMSQLSFCDLAGSERFARTGNTGERLKEAANINTSLLTLGRCIQQLRQNQLGKTAKDRIVPFRESKLTRLFQTYFSGKGKACMLVNISPAASAFDENIQALKFSAIAKQVRFEPEKVAPLPKASTSQRSCLSIALEQGDDGRMSIPWASAEELSEFSKMPELVEEGDGEHNPLECDVSGCDACVEYYRQTIAKLRETLIDTSNQLKQERKDKKKMETRLREEICKEMMQQITDIENHYEQEMEEERQRYEDEAEKKVQLVTTAIHKSVKRKRQEYEESIDDMVSVEILQAEQVRSERKDSEIEKLQAELMEAKKQILKLESLPVSESENVSAGEEVTEKANDELAELMAINNTQKQKLEEMEAELINLYGAKAEQACTEERLNSEISRLKESHAKQEKALNSEIEFLNTENNASSQSSGASTARVEALEKEVEALSQSNALLKDQLATIKEGYQTQLSTTEAVHSLVESKLDSATAKLDKAVETNESLNKEVDQLREKNSQLEQHSQETQKQLITAENKLSNVKMNIVSEYEEERQRQMAALKTEMCAKSELIASLEARVTAMSSDHLAVIEENARKHDTKIKELELEVVAVSRGLQNSDKENEALQSQLNKTENSIQLLEVELQKKTVKLEHSLSENEQLNGQIAERTKEYDCLVNEMGQLKETLNGMSENSTNTKEMESKCDSLTTNMKKLQDQLRRRSIELQGDMSTVQTQLFSTRKELDRIKKDKERLKKANSEYQLEIQSCRKESALRADSLESITEQLSDITARYQEADSNIKSLSSKQHKLEEELVESRSSRAKIEAEHHNLGELLQKSESQSSVLEATVYKLRKEISEHTEQMTKLKSSSNDAAVDGLKQQLDELRKASDSKDKENIELKDEIAILQTTIRESDARCNQFATLASRVKDINEKLDQQKLLHETATRKIEQLTAENSALQEKLSLTSEQHFSVTKLEQQVRALNEDVLSKEKKAASLQVILDARQAEWDRRVDSHETLKQQAEQVEKKLRSDNDQIQAELSTLSSQLSAVEDKARVASAASLTQENTLRSTISDLQEQLSALEEKLKKATKRYSAANLADDDVTVDVKDKLIQELKVAINEQETTMKVQDEVMETKEEQIHKLTKEICDWRLKCQELCDVELEKTSLSSKLNSIGNEKDFLQKVREQLKSQIDSLQQKNADLESQLQEQLEKTNSSSSCLEQKCEEITTLKSTMDEWKANKEELVTELEKVLNEKDDTIKKLRDTTESSSMSDEDFVQKQTKLEEKVIRKDKIILQLEHKIRSQETTIHDLVTGSGRSTRGASREVMDKIKNLEADLNAEKAKHGETHSALERVMLSKDEQVADLKEANIKLQAEIEKLQMKKPARPSDRFKEPSFNNDDELAASTLEMDVTPMSSSKKGTRSTRKSGRKSTRKTSIASSQKENVSSTGKQTTLKRLQEIVEKSTSPLASPAKKLLRVRITPLQGVDKAEETSSSVRASPSVSELGEETSRPRRRRKLYTLEENKLTDTPSGDSSGKKEKKAKASAANIHSIVSRNMRSMQHK